MTERLDRAADDDLGLVPTALLGAGPPGTAQPLQVHFDLKEKLGAPRGGDDRQHDHVPRAGAARRPAAHLAGAALGLGAEDAPSSALGRFWVIDVEYVNQSGESVGTETYTGFGYKREA